MHSRSLRLAAVLTFTAGCVALAAWWIDVPRVAQILASVRPSAVMLALLALLGAFVFRVLRFQLLLDDRAPALRRQTVVSAIGFLAIHVIPLRLGELVRPYLLAEDEVPWGRSVSAIAVERLCDVVALVGMLAIVSTLDPPGELVVGNVDVVSTAMQGFGLGALVLGGALAAFAVKGDALARTLRSIPALGTRVAAFATSVHEGLSTLARRPMHGAIALALSAAVWGCHVAAAAALLTSVSDVPTGASVAVTVTALTVIGVTAMPTLGQVGPYEAGAIAAVVLWGGDRDPAAAFALLSHVAAFTFNTLVGLAGLSHEGLSLGAVVRASQSA